MAQAIVIVFVRSASSLRLPGTDYSRTANFKSLRGSALVMQKQTSSISSLYEIWKRSVENWVKSFDYPSPAHPDEEFSDKCMSIVESIYPKFSEFEAEGLEDILLKIKVWKYQRAPGCNTDYFSNEDRIVISVIHDLERLIKANPKELEEAA